MLSRAPYYLGIDPGQSGAYAILDCHGAVIVSKSFDSWKDIKIKTLSYRAEIKGCCLEKVASKSKQGVKSVFTFGMNYGGWMAFLELLQIPHSLVPPQRWQKTFLGSFPKGESKIRSVDFINRRYPHVDLKKSEHGRSDAICLALYALVLDRRTTIKL